MLALTCPLLGSATRTPIWCTWPGSSGASFSATATRRARVRAARRPVVAAAWIAAMSGDPGCQATQPSGRSNRQLVLTDVPYSPTCPVHRRDDGLEGGGGDGRVDAHPPEHLAVHLALHIGRRRGIRSEERRVGKERRERRG